MALLSRVPKSDLCFWHPVGAHAGETLPEILVRKTNEISNFKFTLWSFAPARADRIYAWRRELASRRQSTCIAVCCGRDSRDPLRPEGQVVWAREYSEDLVVWKAVPHPRMTSYHRAATKDGLVASAFVVSGVEQPREWRVERPRNWYRAGDATWETASTVPTRGQYLIKAPTPSPDGAEVRVVLSVAAPFVVWLR